MGKITIQQATIVELNTVVGKYRELTKDIEGTEFRLGRSGQVSEK